MFYMGYLTEPSQHSGSVAMLIDSPISSCSSSCTWCPDTLHFLLIGMHMPFPGSLCMLFPLLPLHRECLLIAQRIAQTTS